MYSYTNLKESYTTRYDQIVRQHNIISLVRLAIALIIGYSMYALFKHGSSIFFVITPIMIGLFLFLMDRHLQIKWQKRLAAALLQVNEDEISYVQRQSIPFDDGAIFQETGHAYSYDLDLFGPQSLYHHINRSATYIGGKSLSDTLLQPLPTSEIKQQQDAVRELAPLISFRQQILALSRMADDQQEHYEELLQWAATVNQSPPKWLITFSYVSPILVVGLFSTFLITQVTIFGYLSLFFFVLNLILILTQFSKLQAEQIKSGHISTLLKRYGHIIAQIESTDFTSPKLNQLKNELSVHDIGTSQSLKQLSGLFRRLGNLDNVVGALFSNGIYLSHYHTYRKLLVWKSESGRHLRQWLSVIGQFESLGSLANLYYNNPRFNFPEINNEQRIEFKQLGHPLIPSAERVHNDVSFKDDPLIILTGSNMSGKSTFLRTLGVNMVLARAGSSICADNADIHPLPVLVSMRVSDSLSDHESYFFAEVKRLQGIMSKASQQTSFVLLDEILRGTNSDDKRNGTIEVIRKLVGQGSIGAIATHDLEVCQTAHDHPDNLTNKCFEVEIIDNDLAFDYRLRDGICQNQSATFLMKKMGVI